MRQRALLSCCLLLLLSSLVAVPAGAAVTRDDLARGRDRGRVLVYTGDSSSSRSADYAATRSGLLALYEMGREQGWSIVTSRRGERFERLDRFEAVVFLNATGSQLDGAERAAFEDYVADGGGLVAVGAAIGAEPGWTFLGEVLGARATGSVAPSEALVKVADRVHPAGEQLPMYWERTERWYDYDTNVRGDMHVLATVDEDTYDGGDMGFDHPFAWCGDVAGGRSFYTGAGTTAASYGDDAFLSHLAGAISWAAGGEGDCDATVLEHYEQHTIATNENPDDIQLGEPIGFDVLPDGRVITTERTGEVILHEADGSSRTVLADVPVYDVREDGMYGPAVDHEFEENGWVYLYYSPATMDGVAPDGTPYPEATPPGNAPTAAPDPAVWDQWIGYNVLSRVKFVDGPEPYLDMATEQEILRVHQDRGACCHLAGDIAFDSENNLWMVTGDDTPAGGGNSGGFGPFNDQLTTEAHRFRVQNAASGTFTLTFDGETTGPIAFDYDNAALEAALEALDAIDDVSVTGGNTKTISFVGDQRGVDVPLLTADLSGLTAAEGESIVLTNEVASEAGWSWAPHVDARRSSLNTNDLRGKVLRISVNPDGSYDIPDGNMFEDDDPLTAPEIYAMGFRNPFRISLDEDDVAYITDYSPDSRVPETFRGPAGTGRIEIVDEPANYGWPLCYGPDLPYFEWDFIASTPLDPDDPQPFDCAGGPENTSRWNTGRTQTPPVKQPELWYSYNDNRPEDPLGTPCFASYGTNPPGTCPQLFPELGTGGVAPHGAAPYDYDPSNPNPTKWPEYYDESFIFGEFGRDFLFEVRLDEDGEVFKINDALPCGDAQSGEPFWCESPMDMEFHDGHLYVLTYGSGFFRANPGARMLRFEYTGGD